MPREDEGRDQGAASTSQGAPKTAANPQNQERGQSASLIAPGRNPVCTRTDSVRQPHWACWVPSAQPLRSVKPRAGRQPCLLHRVIAYLTNKIKIEPVSKKAGTDANPRVSLWGRRAGGWDVQSPGRRQASPTSTVRTARRETRIGVLPGIPGARTAARPQMGRGLSKRGHAASPGTWGARLSHTTQEEKTPHGA